MNLLSVAKVAGQSLSYVEKVLQGILDALISTLSHNSDINNVKVRLNFKIGYLHIQNGALQFVSETFSNLLNPNKPSIS